MQLDRLYPALERLGWTSYHHQQLLHLETDREVSSTALPARIADEWRGEYGVLGADGARRCVLSGRLGRALLDDERPCTGDFVLVAHPSSSDLGRIEHVFERTGVLRRKTPGRASNGQAIAANVDIGCIVSALTSDSSDTHAARRALNARRIERYLRIVHDARARPLIVVTKADLCADARERTATLADELGISEIVLVSTRTGLGIDELCARIGPGVTAALVGSSGAGKSSLVNRLLGYAAQPVRAVREDERGRHTTTRRRLFVLPEGGLVIDTPGMRELALFARNDGDRPRGVAGDELAALASGCRFRDCRHVSEPGCAVLAAVERGDIAPERLEHAHRLERELARQEQRHDGRQRRQARLANRAQAVAAREALRRKGRDE